MNDPLIDDNRVNRIKVTSLFYNCWKFLMYQQITLIIVNLALVITFLVPIINADSSCNTMFIILIIQCTFSILHNIIFHIIMNQKTPLIRCAFLLKQAKEQNDQGQNRVPLTLRDCKLLEAQDQSLRYPLKLKIFFYLMNIYTIPSFLVQRRRGLLYLKTFVSTSELYMVYLIIKIFADGSANILGCNSDDCSAQLTAFLACKIIFSLPTYLLFIFVPIGMFYVTYRTCLKNCQRRRENQILQQQVGAFELIYTGQIVGEIECGICLTEYSNQDKILTLSCHSLHHFHSSCVQAWLMQSKSCPVCRAELPINKLYQHTQTAGGQAIN